jgi:choline dehydrogenase-like flavoprotein
MGTQDQQRARTGQGVVRQLFETLGALEIMQSPVKIGLHLMGGCAMGTRNSVLDEQFKVRGSQRIIVADSAVFPNAPGINPSLTIMAMAHRAADALLGLKKEARETLL